MSGLTSDVVVIGGGHNGLVAANYLADAGLDTVVVEANESIGGFTSTRAAIPVAPRHLINSFSVDSFFWDAFPPAHELGLERHGLRRTEVDPGHVYLHPDGGSIGFWADPTRTADEIGRFSRDDARAYLEFARVLRRFGNIMLTLARTSPVRPELKVLAKVAREAIRGRADLAELGSFPFASVTEVVAERFTHQVVRDALHAASGSTVPNNSSGSAVGFLWLSTMHRYPCRRPIGGVQAIPDALAARLRSRGGRIRTGVAVAEILVRNGRAVGVRLADGVELRAGRAVLASCDPRTALGRLLPAGTLDPAMRRRVDTIPVSNLNYGQMKVDLALSGRVDLTRHQRWRGDGLDLRRSSFMTGTEAGMQRLFARSGAGLLPDEDDWSLWPVIPTAADPGQAPDGQDTVYLYAAVAPYQPEGGWDAVRDKAAAAIIGNAARYFDGITELEIGRQVLTNVEMASQGNATGGNMTHVDMVLGRAGPLRPARGLSGYTTPVEDLYLGAAGCHPGGGITGGPGYIAARVMIRRLRRRRETPPTES
ncbi:MAG TPA: NAD(P)/FAD-dependent oxidoreductase [Pseudonocardia sp.]|jgi:phytoene dehydrogenase-like protein